MQHRRENPEEKFKQMIETPVPSLICRMAIPTMISMMVTAIYNMTDTFFVGKIGTSATGAVGIAFSLMAIIQAIGLTFGQGCGNYISRLLGRKDREFASKVVATGFVSVFVICIVLAALGIIFLDPLVRLLGATPTIVPYAKAYVRLILIGMPYMAASFMLNNILRFQGSAFYAMLGIGTGGILNIALDPLFIFVFDLGTAGAALATILSQFLSFCILVYHCNVGSNIKIRLRDFTPQWSIYKEIFRDGLPAFYRQGFASMSVVALNYCAGTFGDAAIAAMSIVTRVFQFTYYAILGFGQGYQPVCGFNYGAKRFDRVREGYWFCIRTSVVALVIMAVAMFFFAPQIVSIFRREDAEVISIGAKALRLQALTLPLTSWIVIGNMLLQTTGRGLKASLVAMSRQGIFFLPSIIILYHAVGLFGVQLSQTVADVFSFAMAVPLILSVLRELKGDSTEGVRPVEKA